VKHATLAVLVLASAIAALPASAAAPRSPQVGVLGGTLQTYLSNAPISESINVGTDQLDIQTWKSTISGNSATTLQIALGSGIYTDEIGLYEAHNAAARYPVFRGIDGPGAFAVVTLRSSAPKLVINVFNSLGQLQRNDDYADFETTNFGYYIKSGEIIGRTEDEKNAGGLAAALTFAGTGDNLGCWWLCFDKDRSASGDEGADFDDAVLFLESVNPTPVTKATWGQVKSRFR